MLVRMAHLCSSDFWQMVRLFEVSRYNLRRSLQIYYTFFMVLGKCEIFCRLKKIADNIPHLGKGANFDVFLSPSSLTLEHLGPVINVCSGIKPPNCSASDPIDHSFHTLCLDSEQQRVKERRRGIEIESPVSLIGPLRGKKKPIQS